MKYIVAVSGGVDSVCLIDMLVGGHIEMPDAEYVIAHFDHGIREGSSKDAELVGEMADRYGLSFETERVELGPNTSEEKARDERYKFLQKCRNKHEADSIITAHHQDDIVETAIFNISRGTGWRGLASLKSTDGILRPLLGISKQELINHARKYQLNWIEDPTNQDHKYSRNYIRHKLVKPAQSKDPKFRAKMSNIISDIQNLQVDIDEELDNLLLQAKISQSKYIISRHKLVMWPKAVSLEVIRAIVLKLDENWHPTSAQLNLILNFCKTARPSKTYEVSKHVKISSTNSHLEFIKY